MEKQKIGLGSVKIPLNWWQHVEVFGGPFRQCPTSMVGVKMAQELKLHCDIDIPTRDYDVPDRKILDTELLVAVKMILDGQPLYVGCMGGMGRTGLFLSVLCKAFMVKNPVEFVRKNYYSHAVETDKQYDFVSNFVINPQIRIAVKKARYTSWLRFWKRGLTRIPNLTQATVLK